MKNREVIPHQADLEPLKSRGQGVEGLRGENRNKGFMVCFKFEVPTDDIVSKSVTGPRQTETFFLNLRVTGLCISERSRCIGHDTKSPIRIGMLEDSP